MVVVTPTAHADSFRAGLAAGWDDWTVIGFDGDETESRNRLLANRDGALLAWWQEAARHHPARLTVQADRMLAEETAISGIAGRLYYRSTTRELFGLNMAVRKYNWQRIEPFTAIFEPGGIPWKYGQQPDVQFVRDRAEKVKSTIVGFWPMYLVEGETPPNSNHGPLNRQAMQNHIDSVLASLAVWRPFEGPIYISGTNGIVCDYPVSWNRV